jgi:Holliday junction resolvase
VTEAQLSRNIVKALRKRGAFAFKVFGGHYQRAGLPDVILCYRGRFVGLEVKLPGRESTLTDIQAHTLEEVRKAKGVARLITSVKEAEELLDLLDHKAGK